MKKRLGEILLERSLIDVDQLNTALVHQRQWGTRLGTALVAKGFISEGILTQVLAEHLAIPMVDLARVVVDPKVLQLVPRRLAEQYDVFPIALKEEANGRKLLLLAMVDPLNATAVDEIAFTTATVVKPAIAQISSLEQAIRRHYYGQRVEISPLRFDRKGSSSSGGEAEPMTLVGTGGSERTIDSNPQPVELTDEIPAVQAQHYTGPPLAAPPFEYNGQPTGVFMMPPGGPSSPSEQPPFFPMSKSFDLEAIESLEKKFWALVRVLAKRGLVSKDEFLAELKAGEEIPKT